MQCPDYKVFKIKNITEMIFDNHQLHTSSMCNNAAHNLTLITMTVTRFVGTGSFLIRYPNGHTK